MAQYFKGDELELKIEGAAQVVLDRLVAEVTAWFDNAYTTAGLGEVLYDNNLVPLTRAVARDIFIKNYGQILEKWEYVGSFASYLYVFTQIFGPSTQIRFNRLAPGALEINITAKQTELFNWLANKAASQSGPEEAAYITDHEGNRISLRAVTGIGDFYEVHGVLDSLNPAGIYLQVNFRLQ